MKPDGKKPKPRKEKVWCEFHGRIDDKLANLKEIRVIKISPITKTKYHALVGYKPRLAYMRCPQCNKRLKIHNKMADGTMYLFSFVSRHKKTIKV